jgi:GNAT superfamily N-acetyltransferase
MIIKPVRTRRERNIFLTFPWRIYKDDPLWVPPLLSEKAKAVDPQRGLFFKNGYAELFIAWQDGKPVGTIACGEDQAVSAFRGYGECMFGFFECIQDYAVAEALLRQAEDWARQHGLTAIYGPYHLDREDSRGLLVEGRDRPPVILCGHTPPYYVEYFERYGLPQLNDDGLAYEVRLDPSAPKMQRLHRLAERVRQRKDITVRGARLDDIEGEIDRIQDLQNRGLEHMSDYTPFKREDIESLVRPLIDLVDPELVLFAEIDGQAVGWFPGVPNFNEVVIHLNGLRYPWDYLRLLHYSRLKPKCLSIKSVVVPPEYWDTGVAVLLFDEMVQRALAQGYEWLDLSITGEANTDTYPLAHHMGARIYKRYRFYRKPLSE